MTKLLTYLCILVCSIASQAQIHCGSVSFEPNTPVMANMLFDSFSQYEAGITINQVGNLRVHVEDLAIPDPDCRWFLTMSVDNNPLAGTDSEEWETLATYGAGAGAKPRIDILQIRVRNACQTSPISGTFVNFTDNLDIISIIRDMLPLTPAGSCAPNVNGPGNANSHYNEFNFAIDIRVRPGYDFDPGVYELAVRFHLEEQM